MTMVFAAVRAAPLKQMSHHRPPVHIITFSNLVMVSLGAMFVCLSQLVIGILLRSCTCFQGGSGGSYLVSLLPLDEQQHKDI